MGHIVDVPAVGRARLPRNGSRYQPPRMIELFVERRAITTALRDAQGKVVVLTGPQGCGKSTWLAGRYHTCSQQDVSVHWLSLSAEDNDVAVLRRHLRKAFELNDDGAENELPDVPSGVVGFIDGLEMLTDNGAHELLERFVLSLPADSSIYLSAIRLRGSLLHGAWLHGIVQVLGPEVMRMDDQEAMKLLGPHWTSAEVQSLNAFVDGWAAGLRFLQRDPDVCRRLVAGEAVLPAQMSEYFEEVVCSILSPDIRQAVMELSVLDRFTPALLRAAPQVPCSWALVDDLVRNGLFIRHVDAAGDWVAFQPAFGVFLGQRLRRLDLSRFEFLKLFVATWMKERGYAAQAIRHAVTIEQTPLAARLIEEAGAVSVDLGDGPDVALETFIGPSQAAELPLLFLGQTYQRIRSGRYREARVAMDEAWRLTEGFTRLNSTVDQELARDWAQMFQMVFPTIYDQPYCEADLAWLEAAMWKYVGREQVLAASVASLLAFSHLENARHDESVTICNIGLNTQHAPQENKISVFLNIHQACNYLARESVDKAAPLVERALQVACRECGPSSYEVLSSRTLMGVLHYERGELDEARRQLLPVVEQVRGVNGWVRLYAEAYSALAAVSGIEQGYEAAEQFIRHGEAFARERELERLSLHLQIIRLVELTRAGRWREAMALVEDGPLRSHLEQQGGGPYELATRVPALLAAARLMVELGRPPEALDYLERIDQAYLNSGDCRLQFGFRSLAMRAAFAQRRYNAAFEHLQAALSIAQEAGLLQRAREVCLPLREIYAWAERQGKPLPPRLAEWLQQLSPQAVPEVGAIADSHVRTHSPTKSYILSPRESEIITLMAEGLINKEIAARLGISEGTVKTHRKKIHEKLGATCRSQAIGRARELLIL